MICLAVAAAALIPALLRATPAGSNLTSCHLSSNPDVLSTDCVDVPPPNVAMPALGVSYTSPFNATCKRIGVPAGVPLPQMVPNYAKSPAWNADGSLLLLYTPDNGIWSLLNGRTYAYIRELVFPASGQDQDVRWSKSDPNVFYYVRNSRFCRFDIQTNTETVLRDFASMFGGTCEWIHNGDEGNSDDADRYWAFYCQGYDPVADRDAQRGVIVYDSSADVVLASRTFAAGGICGTNACPPNNDQYINWIGMSHSGDYVMINWDNNTPSLSERGLGQEAFTRTLEYKSKSSEVNWHNDAVVMANGTDAFVGPSRLEETNGYQAIRAVRLEDGVILNSCMMPESRSGYHFSGRSRLRSWVLVSTYEEAESVGTGKFASEVFALNMDTCEVRRIAHAQSARGDDYFAEPHAVMDFDFDKVVWGSNWRVSGNADLPYVAEWTMPRLTIGDASRTEGDGGTVILQFTVTLAQ